MEIFKPIPGYSLYEISNYGRIKTFNWKNKGIEAIMKPALDPGGYFRTMLKRDSDGKIGTVKVHRLVALTFLGNPTNANDSVNHKDSIRSNNHIDNLEWCTHSQNIKHAYDKGNVKLGKGENHSRATLTTDQVLEIRARFKKRIITREILAKEYNTSPSAIKDIIARKSWKSV